MFIRVLSEQIRIKAKPQIRFGAVQKSVNEVLLSKCKATGERLGRKSRKEANHRFY